MFCPTHYLQKPQHLIKEIDIWRAANQMMKMFGDEADLAAARHADALMDLDDNDGFHAWVRVLVAIKNLSHKKPLLGEAVN